MAQTGSGWAPRDEQPIEAKQETERHEKQHGESRCKPPIEHLARVEGDEIGKHLVLRAPDQGRRDVIAERQDGHEHRAGRDSRKDQGQVDARER